MNTTIIHPMFVHFPIALIVTSFVLATILLIVLIIKGTCHVRNSWLTNTTLTIIGIGLFSGIIAIITGIIYTTNMIGIMGEIRAEHITSAITSIILTFVAFALLWLFKKSSSDKGTLYVVFYIFSLVSMVMISVTGHLGGQMVFGI